MTYDEIIDLLTAKCLENGKGVAKLGNDVAFMMSEEYLLGLLVAARNDPNHRVLLVVLDSESVKPAAGLPN